MTGGGEERKRGREAANASPRSSRKCGNTEELDCRSFCSFWVAFGLSVFVVKNPTEQLHVHGHVVKIRMKNHDGMTMGRTP